MCPDLPVRILAPVVSDLRRCESASVWAAQAVLGSIRFPSPGRRARKYRSGHRAPPVREGSQGSFWVFGVPLLVCMCKLAVGRRSPGYPVVSNGMVILRIVRRPAKPSLPVPDSPRWRRPGLRNLRGRMFVSFSGMNGICPCPRPRRIRRKESCPSNCTGNGLYRCSRVQGDRGGWHPPLTCTVFRNPCRTLAIAFRAQVSRPRHWLIPGETAHGVMRSVLAGIRRIPAMQEWPILLCSRPPTTS